MERKDKLIYIHTCLEAVRPLGKYHARIAPSESTTHDGFDTNGNGFENKGGNLLLRLSSVDPAKPLGRGGKVSE